MNPTIDIDVRQWQQAARELQATSKRSLPDFLNGQALAVAVRALKLTKQASRADIETELGQIATEVRTSNRGRNAGKVRRGTRVLRDDSLAERILLAHFRDTGEWLAKGRSIMDRARALIGKRVRSISFVRSGWIPAVRKLTGIVRQKPAKAGGGIAGAKQFGRDKGTARPAIWKFGIMHAEIENSIPGHARGKAVDKVATDGLRVALQESARDMIETLAKRLKKDMAKQGAK